MSRTVKKSFYTNDGRAQDIEMPPLDYQFPDGSNPQQPVEQQVESNDNVAFNNVPNEIPQDVADELEKEVDNEIEPEQSESAIEQVAKAPVKKQEENFKAIREAKERAEKDRERAERERDLLLSKLVEMQSTAPKQKLQEEIKPEDDSDLDFNVNDDDLLEGKHAKKLLAKMRNMEERLKNYQSQSTQTTVEAKIRQNFPDFEQVVSEENVYVLNEQFPELAASLRDTKDFYNKAAAAYSVIKKMGIYEDKTMYNKEKELAMANAKKPRPLTSVSPQQGDSPLSKANAFANGLTPELKEQMRKEMNAARKAH